MIPCTTAVSLAAASSVADKKKCYGKYRSVNLNDDVIVAHELTRFEVDFDGRVRALLQDARVLVWGCGTTTHHYRFYGPFLRTWNSECITYMYMYLPVREKQVRYSACKLDENCKVSLSRSYISEHHAETYRPTATTHAITHV